MASDLPSGKPSSKTVNDFGLGPYDLPEGKSHHEDEEEPPPKALPDGGGSENPSPELLYDMTASQSLPSDADNPAARLDYYDRLQTGTTSVDDIWADEDAGVYANDGPVESLPGAATNDVSMDDFLGALGNAWSGYVVQDQSNPAGHPSPNFMEQSDYTKRVPGDWRDDAKTLVTTSIKNMSSRPVSMLRKVSTDISLVGDLASKFLKEYGKKDLTRRHVMAFLQDGGHHIYLASDVIRCLKLRHQVTIADVMDQFPIRKAASEGMTDLTEIRNRVIDLQASAITDPDTCFALGRCAANLAHALAALEGIGDQDG